MTDAKKHPASFRDPAGFIFKHEDKYYRQVNQVYAADFDLFNKSGLYDLLVSRQQLIAHTQLEQNLTGDANWYTTLLPAQISFISYPYEWCFAQWKDAALLTLDLIKTCMEHGMILKDATPFNIQFINGRPVFIDSLSFEKYDASKPWVAYRQFIACFIGPLLLAKYHSAELLKMFQIHPDGIPLRIISKLLPWKSTFNANVFLHVHMPGMLSTKKNTAPQKQAAFNQQKLTNIISNLHSFVQSMVLPSSITQWNNYYEETILSDAYAAARMVIIESWLKEMDGKTVLDVGTNTGLYAKAAAAAGKFTIAVDADTACIDKLYLECRQKDIRNLLPLCVDFTNPSPAIGWNNAERTAFASRAQADIVMALALMHHLAIGKNVSFEQLADGFGRLGPQLIIEFVPKTDPKVQLLLQDRVDIFDTYNEAFFLEVFEKSFTVIKRVEVPGTERVMFMMKRKDAA